MGHYCLCIVYGLKAFINHVVIISSYVANNNLLRLFLTVPDNMHSIPMKPYIKGQYWMITTIPLDDNYQPGSYHPVG